VNGARKSQPRIAADLRGLQSSAFIRANPRSSWCNFLQDMNEIVVLPKPSSGFFNFGYPILAITRFWQSSLICVHPRKSAVKLSVFPITAITGVPGKPAFGFLG